jgi:hypothetical protein
VARTQPLLAACVPQRRPVLRVMANPSLVTRLWPMMACMGVVADAARARRARRAAGGRSRRKFRTFRRAWLRKQRRRDAVLCAICLGIAAPVNAPSAGLTGHD